MSRLDDTPRDAPTRASPTLSRRVTVVGGAFLAGVAGGGVALAVATYHFSSLPDGADAVFLLGILALGFGVLGWSGSVLAGRGFEEMQRHLDTGAEWTEMDSRRAMARIGGFGAGVMLAAMTLGTLLA
ncbi:hypothetical protein GL213_01965 [Halogeometricum borinquense]|uniref:Uncharacterized protein n=1 Tax=Halogeometricum borinquense TaxID=60847 RepID=A0A6C0UQG5_9EURY|nr:hypothetical protein [Halogeometricum borinquense]QIB76149.1 hypothetical protein G3I44_18885 [Halogeometricum borinquense]QIQ75412.1 hypothetical protein GL213_01965 [Halogeometricum borinquense]